MPVGDLVAHLRELTFEQSLHIGHPAFFAYIFGAGTVPGAARRAARGRAQPVPRRLPARPGRGRDRAAPDALAGRALRAARGRRRDDHDRRRDGELRRRSSARATQRSARRARAGRARARPGRALRLRGGARRDPPRRRHARPRRGRRARDRGRRRAADARRRARGGDRARLATPACARSPSARRRARRRRARSTRCRRSPTSPREHGAVAPRRRGYGGAVVLSDELRGLLAGDRARRLARRRPAQVALHRAVGRLRAAARLRPLLSARSTPTPRYIWLDEAARHGVDFAMHGPQFSRGFAALKVWVSLLAHGRAAYGRRIAPRRRLARYLGELVDEHPDFELMCPPRLSICCFRYRPRGWRAARSARPLNERLMTAIHADGRVLLLQRGDRRALRPARLHRQLPHRGRGRRAAARRRRRARPARAAAERGLRASGPCGSCGRCRTPRSGRPRAGRPGRRRSAAPACGGSGPGGSPTR